MNMETISRTLERLSYRPVLLTLYTFGIFLVIISIGCLIAYIVACIVNRTTRMAGVMKVGVALNVWPEDTAEADCPRLSYGEFFIGMQDPAEVLEDRVDPKLNPVTLAQCRQYSVSKLLQRFCTAYEGAGFREDPSGELLRHLLDTPDYCTSLGKIYRRSAKKGLQVWTALYKKEENDPGKLAIYHRIPERFGEEFRYATGCDAKMLCITLEYGGRNAR